jgi:hypothetical protein
MSPLVPGGNLGRRAGKRASLQVWKTIGAIVISGDLVSSRRLLLFFFAHKNAGLHPPCRAAFDAAVGEGL